MPHQETINAIASVLAPARRVLFITGAGISADSGLPTYRGVGGLYNDADTDEGIPIETALSGGMFRVRPDITWTHLSHIEENCRGAQPNAAHRAIAELEQLGKDVLVFTQNVDGLHKLAGSSAVLEIHGNIHHLYCTACDYEEIVPDLANHDIPPACPECGGLMRPNVILFDEALPQDVLERFWDEVEEGFDLVVVIGTSGAFPYILEPFKWFSQIGVPTVEINPLESRMSPYARIHLPLGAAAGMQGVMEALVGF